MPDVIRAAEELVSTANRLLDAAKTSPISNINGDADLLPKQICIVKADLERLIGKFYVPQDPRENKEMYD